MKEIIQKSDLSSTYNIRIKMVKDNFKKLRGTGGGFSEIIKENTFQITVKESDWLRSLAHEFGHIIQAIAEGEFTDEDLPFRIENTTVKYWQEQILKEDLLAFTREKESEKELKKESVSV